MGNIYAVMIPVLYENVTLGLSPSQFIESFRNAYQFHYRSRLYITLVLFNIFGNDTTHRMDVQIC